MTTPLLLCGDPHGQFDQIIQAGQLYPDSAIVLLGDMDLSQPIEDVLELVWPRVYWIHGNHDTDTAESAENLWTAAGEGRWLHRRSIMLTNGLSVAGLGGVFRERVWVPGQQPRYLTPRNYAFSVPMRDRWRDGPPRKAWSSIFPSDIDELLQIRSDVLVTHEAPSYHPCGFDAIDKLARAMGARWVIHGHHHDEIDSRAAWRDQGFASFGVGMRGVLALWPDGSTARLATGKAAEAERTDHVS